MICHLVEGPSVGVSLMSSPYSVVVIDFGDEHHRGEVPSLSHHTRGHVTPHGSSPVT